jgi:hypothetical protein
VITQEQINNLKSKIPYGSIIKYRLNNIDYIIKEYKQDEVQVINCENNRIENLNYTSIINSCNVYPRTVLNIKIQNQIRSDATNMVTSNIEDCPTLWKTGMKEILNSVALLEISNNNAQEITDKWIIE